MGTTDRKWLDEKITELGLIEAFCEKHGEVDGATAARAQRRALQAELDRLQQADAGAGH